MKKGQISLFILMGIVILIAGALIFYLFTGEKKTPMTEMPGAVPLNQYLSTCFNDLGKASIIRMGMQGGYLGIPEHAQITEKRIFAVNYDNGIIYSQTTENVADELKKFIERGLSTCIDEEMYPGSKISYENPSVDVKIGADQIVMTADFPVTIADEKRKTVLKDFAASYQLSLPKMMETATAIAEHTRENPNWLDLSYLSKQEVSVGVFPFDKETTLIGLLDKNAKITPNGFMFMFALKQDHNRPPILDNIPNFVLTKSYPFTYQLHATDPDDEDYKKDGLQYYSPNALINIDKYKGALEFTPKIPGEYTIDACAKDMHGASTCKPVRFDIR